MYIYISILPSILAVSLSRCAGSGCRRVPHRVPRRVRLEWATRWCAVAQGRAAAAAPQANDTGALGQARLLCPASLSRPPPHPPLSPLPSPPSLYPRLPSPLPCLPPLATAPSPSSFLPSFWDPPLLFQPHPSPTPALGVLPPSLGGSTPGFLFVCLFVCLCALQALQIVDMLTTKAAQVCTCARVLKAGTPKGTRAGTRMGYSEGQSKGYNRLSPRHGGSKGTRGLSGTHGYPIDCAARGSAPNRKQQSARKCEVLRNHPSHPNDGRARTYTRTRTYSEY